MVETFVFLAVAVAIGYAVGNVMDKILFSKYLDRSRTMQFLSGLFAPIVALPVLFIGPITVFDTVPLLLTLVSGVIFFGGGYLQMKATQLGEVSEMTLLLKAIPIFTLILSRIFLNEMLTDVQYLGLALILAGSFLVTIEPRKGLPRISATLPNFLTLLAAFLFATTFVLTKYLLDYSPYWNIFFWQQIGYLLPAPFLLFFPVIKKEVTDIVNRPRAKGLPLFLASAVVYAISNLVNTLALRDAPASLVTGIISADALFVVLIVYLLSRLGMEHFEEKLTPQSIAVKLIAAILFIIGAYLAG